MSLRKKSVGGSSIEGFLAEQMQDPSFADEYQKSEWEYQAAKAVIRLRLQHKMSQEQLANQAGVPPSTIARIESMSFSPTVRMLNKIAAATETQLFVDFVEKTNGGSVPQMATAR